MRAVLLSYALLLACSWDRPRQLIDYCKSPTTSCPQEVHLAQKLLQKYWDRTKDDIAKPKGGIETIRIGKDVPK